MATLGGTCDQRFQAVGDAFEANFEERGEVGAAVALVVDGETVVDLWGGVADPAAGREWSEDTLTMVFSTTKGLTATCALLLWQRGELDIDAPVASVWPEFAAEGKERVTTRQVLSHQGGLPVFDEPISVAECNDLDLVAARLAAQRPRWEPGTAHGYHAITYGWLVGEVIRRVSGKTTGEFFASEIARPLDLEAWIGLPPEHEDRVSKLQPMNFEQLLVDGIDERMAQIASVVMDQQSLTFQVFTNPPFVDVNDFNSPAVHQAEWPAANGIATARSLAQMYEALATERVLNAETLDAAETPQVSGPDRVLVVQTAFGLGFALASEVISYGPGGRGFGHDGAGGSVAFGDRQSRLGFSYVMNQMSASLGNDRRAQSLIRAVYASLGESV